MCSMRMIEYLFSTFENILNNSILRVSSSMVIKYDFIFEEILCKEIIGEFEVN